MNNPEILVIDDELPIRRLLGITLEGNGYLVREAATGKEGLTALAQRPADLVILDLGLPDESGHSILLKLREWYTHPVMILSVENSEEAIVKALDAGANDYLTKPFRTGELLARIRTLLRSSNSNKPEACLDFQGLQVDLAARLVKKNGLIIKLTSTEYTLLSLFVRNEGKVLTHRYLLSEVWGPSFVTESQYLRVYIAQLRKKIEDDPNKPLLLVTEQGVGYRFSAG